MQAPHGLDFISELNRFSDPARWETIYYVGANVGQHASGYLAHFPNAHIHAFEPASSNFAELQFNFAGNLRVSCHQLALGASPGHATLFKEGGPTVWTLKEHLVKPTAAREPVVLTTVDSFCTEMQHSRIDFLKIDTEGSDLDVLEGAAEMFSLHRVAFVQVELGMNPTNHRHVPAPEVVSFMERRSYFIFGIYEQTLEWITDLPILRRADYVFVSKHEIDRLLENRRQSASSVMGAIR